MPIGVDHREGAGSPIAENWVWGAKVDVRQKFLLVMCNYAYDVVV